MGLGSPKEMPVWVPFMRMKRAQGTKRLKGLCLCHKEEHRFRIAFRTLHRQKFEVVGE